MSPTSNNLIFNINTEGKGNMENKNNGLLYKQVDDTMASNAKNLFLHRKR